MQFTVSLELEKQELEALAKGNFDAIREDFFKSIEFCEFVIQNFDLNADFFELALNHQKLSNFSMAKIFKKFNLFEIPGLCFSTFEMKQALYFWTKNHYSYIDNSYWKDWFDTIYHFLGTSLTLITAKNCQCKGKMLKGIDMISPSILYLLAELQRMIENHDIESVRNLIYSSDLQEYWQDDYFINIACDVLQPIASEIVTLPISTKHLKALTNYAKTSENYIWALHLYIATAKMNNSFNTFAIDNVLEAIAYHDIHLDEFVSAYKSGTYIADGIELHDISSWNSFEKALYQQQPKMYAKLEKKILKNVEENPDDWFFSQYYFRGTIHSKVSKYLEKNRGFL